MVYQIDMQNVTVIRMGQIVARGFFYFMVAEKRQAWLDRVAGQGSSKVIKKNTKSSKEKEELKEHDEQRRRESGWKSISREGVLS